MRSIVFLAALVCSAGSAFAEPDENAPAAKSDPGARGRIVEFTSASGKPLGSVTTIGGITYFMAADGSPLGTAQTIDGRRVYKSY